MTNFFNVNFGAIWCNFSTVLCNFSTTSCNFLQNHFLHLHDSTFYGRVWLPASSPTRPTREANRLFGCLVYYWACIARNLKHLWACLAGNPGIGSFSRARPERLHARGHPREAVLLPEAPTIISLTAPHRSLSPLFSTLPTLTGGGGLEQRKKTTGLHHRRLRIGAEEEDDRIPSMAVRTSLSSTCTLDSIHGDRFDPRRTGMGNRGS